MNFASLNYVHMLFLRFFLIFSVVCMASCAGQNDETFALQKLRQYTLPLPTGISLNSQVQKPCLNCSETDGDLLYYLSKEDVIIVYDITMGNIVEQITPFQEGPHNVGEVTGLTVYDRDSIFLAAIGNAGYTVINRKAEIVDELRLNWEEDQRPDYTNLANRFNVELGFGNNSIYIPQRIPIYGYRPPTVNHKPLVKYDVISKKSSLYDFQFPSRYYTSNLPLAPTFTSDDQFLYYGLIKHHHVFRINKFDGVVDSVSVRSQFAPEVFINMSGLAGMVELKTHMASTPHYNALLPDPARDYIYRIVVLPPKDLAAVEEDYQKVYDTPERFSIIVCDRELNILHEQEFPEREYNPYGIFINKEGLHLPKTHPDFFVERGKEDEMVYEVFAPKLD